MQRRVFWQGALFTFVLMAACHNGTNATPARDQAPVVTTPVPQAVGKFSAVVPDFAQLAERVMPAVVSISVEQHVRGGVGEADPLDVFRFFGGVPHELENHALGSGFVIDSTGLVLTNNHVVERASSIEVTLVMPDGSDLRVGAKVVGVAPDYDVALIKTDTDVHAATIALGDSDATRIGNWVMAVGNPFGLDHSVSVGIISAKQRRDVQPGGRQGLYDFIQTDASINPGNSGGPLIDMHGDVIGINSAINAQGQGIGFAIPVNMVKEMLPQLKKGGRYLRSWIGIKVQPLTQELAQTFGLTETHGVLVAQVLKNGPGAKAGLKEGDIILEFDNKKLMRSSDLTLFAAMAGVDKTVPLVVWRDKARQTLAVTLEAFPEEDEAETEEAGGEAEVVRPGMGLVLVDVVPKLHSMLGNKGAHGVMVQAVEPGSVAARSGVHRGDIILDVNDEPVTHAAEVVRRLRGAKSGDVLRVKIERQGARSFLALRKP